MNLTAAQAADGASPVARRRRVPLMLLPVLSMGGIAVSGYLTYVRLTHTEISCSIVRGCETVNSSQYAAVGAVPIAVLGLAFYILTLLLSLTLLFGPVAAFPWTLLSLFGLTLSGSLYSGYLTYIEVAVLQALCQWCLISAAIVVTMCGISTWTLLRPAGAAPD